MCFPSKNKKKYESNDLEGIENTSQNNSPLQELIDSLLHHVDNISLNVNFESGIHGFVYETKDEIIVVYTTDEAHSYYELGY